MKSIQYQTDGEKFIIYLGRYALHKGACDRGETSVQGNKMQAPGSSIPPLRAAAVTDDLYKNPAHVCKRNIAGLAGGRQLGIGAGACDVYYQTRKIINFDFVKKFNKSA